MLGDAERARAPVAASSAKQGHRVLHAPCSAHLAELARSSAAAAITTVTTIVLQEDYIPTRVKVADSNRRRDYGQSGHVARARGFTRQIVTYIAVTALTLLFAPVATPC